MKLKSILILSLVGGMLLTGCSKTNNDSSESTFTKAMSEGKLAIASKEYEKAEGMFNLALQENKEDEEAKALHNQTVLIIEAKKLAEEGNIDDAKAKLEELNSISSNIDIVKKGAEELLSTVNANNSEESLEITKDTKEEDVQVKDTKVEKSNGNLVLDYVVNQSEEDMNGSIYRDGNGKIILAESDYTMDLPDEEGERLVSVYVPETSVRFSLKNIGEETIKNPVINFYFNDMAIEFEPSEKWQGIGHIRGIGTWYEVRWTPEPGTTIQPDIPIDFTFGFQNASIYSDNASIDITLSGDNFKAKKFNIPVKLINHF